MRVLFLLPVMFVFSNSPDITLSAESQTDTTAISHLLDGNITEWPAEKFMTDKTSKMEYAVDNNNETLFLAVNVPGQAAQKRIMQEGMTLYVDIKGKKKENRGIEFPVKMDNMASIANMKLFGFSDGEPVAQNINNPGTVNIAIAWDSSFVMHIEYNIPMKLLDETVAELNNKKISVGWKLNESATLAFSTQPATTTGGSTTTRLVGVPAGTRPPGNNRSVSNLNSDPAVQSIPTRSQPFWTSYTIIF